MEDTSWKPGAASPLITRVQGISPFRSLRAAIERSDSAARAVAEELKGRAIDRADATLSGKRAADLRAHVTGLRGTSFAFVAEAARQRLGRPIVVVCPDGEVTPEMDRQRILWGAGDITENRAPLSRWHPDYADAFQKWLEQ